MLIKTEQALDVSPKLGLQALRVGLSVISPTKPRRVVRASSVPLPNTRSSAPKRRCTALDRAQRDAMEILSKYK